MIEGPPPWNKPELKLGHTPESRNEIIQERNLALGALVVFRYSQEYAPTERNRWKILDIGEDKRITILLQRKIDPKAKVQPKPLALEVEPEALKLFVSAWVKDNKW